MLHELVTMILLCLKDMEANMPTNHHIRFRIANIEIHLADISRISGDFNTAMAAYRAVLQVIQPEHDLLAAQVMRKRGMTHLSLAQYSAAVGDFRNALERFGEGTDNGEVADSKKHLGIALMKRGMGTEAITYLEEAAGYHKRKLRLSRSIEDVESLKEITELLVAIHGKPDIEWQRRD